MGALPCPGPPAALLGAATTLAYVFWETAMQRGDLIAVAAASYLTPLLSTLASCLYLGAAPGLGLWIGCLFLLAGAGLSRASVQAPEAGRTACRSVPPRRSG